MTDLSLDNFFDEQNRQTQLDFQAISEERTQRQSSQFDFDVDEESDIFSFEDTLFAIPRGVEGFGRSIASLVPGVDLDDERFFGRSETVVGAGLESIVQFGLGFAPGLGIASALGKTRLAISVAKTLSASRSGRFLMTVNQGAIAGAFGDFIAFDGHEDNFSALIETMPALRNPLTNFLATDQEDSQVVSRIKNVLEGFGMGAALGAVLEGARGLKALRAKRGVATTAEQLKKIQGEAVDPGRLKEGLDNALGLKGAPEIIDADELGVAPTRIDTEDFGPSSEPNGPVTSRKDVPEIEADAAKSAADSEAATQGAAESRADDVPAAPAPAPTAAQRIKEVLKRVVGDGEAEIPIEALAFKRSEGARIDPQAHPRGPEALENGLDANNTNLTNFVLDEGAAHVLRGYEDANLAGLKGTKPITNTETLLSAHQVAANYAGIPLSEWMAVMTGRIENITQATRESLATAVSVKQISAGLANEQVKLMRLALEGDAVARRKVQAVVEQYSALHESLFDLGTARGQALQSQKIKIEGSGPAADIIDALAESKRTGGKEGHDRLFEKVTLAMGDGDTDEQIARMIKFSNMTLGRQVYRAVHEAFVNSLVSGPRTWTVQPLSAFMASVYKPIENMVGAVFLRNDEVFQRSMFELQTIAGSFSDSVKYAFKAGKDNAPIFTKNLSMRDDGLETIFEAGLFGSKEDTWSGNLVRTLGSIVNFPTKVIKGVDELSKQMVGRSTILADARIKGVQQGMSMEEAAIFAQDKLEKIVVDGQLQTEALGRRKATAEAISLKIPEGKERLKFVEENYLRYFDETMSDSMTRAVDVANEVTQQTPLERGGPAQKTQAALDAVPLGRFIVPFFRTPVNLAKFVGQRIDIISAGRVLMDKKFGVGLPALENTRSRFLREMMGSDKSKQAEAVGRVATGMGMIAWAGGMASSGVITGRGPSDPGQRQDMLDAGWLPYSIKTGNGYVQYLRMDPFASFLGLSADFMDTMRMAGDDDDAAGKEIATAMLVSFSNTFTQRSFLTGIGQVISALEDPQANMASVVEQYAGNIIPNGLNQAVTLFGDDALKDTHGILERLQARTPGLSDGATPRRNMLGEVIDRSQAFGEDSLGAFYGMFVPIAYREVTSDTIRKELFALQHGFQAPRTSILGVDLRDISNDRTGQTAHDRWSQLHGQVKIGGRTLRQELSTLIRSPQYRALSAAGDTIDGSPRVNLIQAVLSRYRDEAFDQTLNEFPQLAAEMQRREDIKVDRRQGIRVLRTSGLEL